jgi:hypothetical protein
MESGTLRTIHHITAAVVTPGAPADQRTCPGPLGGLSERVSRVRPLAHLSAGPGLTGRSCPDSGQAPPGYRSECFSLSHKRCASMGSGLVPGIMVCAAKFPFPAA